MLFAKEHIPLIEKRIKTQTRRRHKYLFKLGKSYYVKINWFKSTNIRIIITRIYKQKLGDITEEESFKEGGYTIDQFKKIWIKINKTWDSDEIVTVYEFKLSNEAKPVKLNGFLNFITTTTLYFYIFIVLKAFRQIFGL